MLDFATSGVYVTDRNIKHFDGGRGVFNPDHSDTYHKMDSDDAY